MVPTTATHNFWAESDPQAKAGKLTQFIKDVALMGGLNIAAIDTEGRPGVTYRAKLAGESVERTARQDRRERVDVPGRERPADGWIGRPGVVLEPAARQLAPRPRHATGVTPGHGRPAVSSASVSVNASR